MNGARFSSRGRFPVSVRQWIGLLFFIPTALLAQLAQQNTNAMRSSDLADDAELFGGLEARRNEEGAILAPESPGDADLGEQVILQGPGRYDPFTVSLESLGIFTSNAGLTDGNEDEDFYNYTELGLRYIPRLTDKVFGNFSASYGIYRYADHTSLDFDSLETSAGLMRIFPELNNLVGWVNYDYTRLTGDNRTLLTDHSIELGLYYPIPIEERHFAFASYVSAISLDGNPALARRNEHGITLGYAFLPVDRLELSAYYQFFFYDYHKLGRNDLFQDFGLGLAWGAAENLVLGLQTSYSINDSNIRGGDYKVGEFGASVYLALEF